MEDNTNKEKLNITESNKLIAQFMGYEYIPNLPGLINKPGWWLKNTPSHIREIGSRPNKFSSKYFLCRHHKELRYYNSWSWLMPVVEKIESLDLSGLFDNENFEGISVDIENGHCYIFVNLKYDPPHRICGKSQHDIPKIKVVYGVILEFINWYNEKK